MHESELEAAEMAYVTSRPLTAADADGDERVVEAALRPRTLAEVVGQERVCEQLSLVLEAARGRQRVPDHVLLSGPPGLGKTTLAMIIAAEMNYPLRLTSGPAITHAGDLAAILSGLTSEGDVLFVDEIHRMSRPAEEMLYMAMEDFRVDVVIGKGPGATAIPLEIPPFTLVGATTRAGLLPSPLRDRFGFTAHLEYYDPEDLERIVRRSATLLDVELRDDGGARSRRSRGTPRIANRLLRRVRDFAQVRADGVVTRDLARAALELFEVDESGLDRLDLRRAGRALPAVRRWPGRSQHACGGGQRGAGYRRGGGRTLPGPQRSPRPYAAGRVATPSGWRHLGRRLRSSPPRLT